MSNFIKRELIPYVVIYKNLFTDINKTHMFFENVPDSGTEFITPWENASNHIEYLNIGRRRSFDNLKIDELSKLNTDESKILLEIMSLRKDTLNDYISEYIGKDIWPVEISEFNENSKYWSYFGFGVVRHEDAGNDEHNHYLGLHLDSAKVDYDYGKHHIITTMIYLNDDYMGGEIEFYLPGQKLVSYKPSAGDIILFPSFYPYYHSVRKPIGGHRYGIRTSYDLDCFTKDLPYHNLLPDGIDGFEGYSKVFNEDRIIKVTGEDLFND